jgi:hypothetical protein
MKGWWSGSRCSPYVEAPVPQKKKINKQKNAFLHINIKTRKCSNKIF